MMRSDASLENVEIAYPERAGVKRVSAVYFLGSVWPPCVAD
jgi:hypothetical protein